MNAPRWLLLLCALLFYSVVAGGSDLIVKQAVRDDLASIRGTKISSPLYVKQRRCADSSVSQLLNRADLPPAVQKTGGKVSEGATIRGWLKRVGCGNTEYEMTMTQDGHDKVVLMDSNGVVLPVFLIEQREVSPKIVKPLPR